MKKRYVALLLVAGWTVGFLLSHFGHVYPTGAFFDMPGGHWLGFEIAPTFGPFWDVT